MILGIEDDRSVFLATLRDAVHAYEWRCHAYCLMSTHYHLMLETPRSNLPEGMQWLNGTYGTRFNAGHETSGHVFQGRYDARVIRSHAHALEVARYVPLNPIRAGLCTDPARWAWSSYRATAGIAPRPSFLTTGTILGWFGSGYAARAEFCAFVLAGVGIADPHSAALDGVLADGTLERIRFAHEDCGYPLRDIADRLGVHHTTLLRRLRSHAPKGV